MNRVLEVARCVKEMERAAGEEAGQAEELARPVAEQVE